MPIWFYQPESPALHKAQLRISVAAFYHCTTERGPKELSEENKKSFMAMIAKETAKKISKGQQVTKTKAFCRDIEPRLQWPNARMHALYMERPISNQTFVAYVHRVAFSDEGLCFRMTIQGPKKQVEAELDKAMASFQAMAFHEQKKSCKGCK